MNYPITGFLILLMQNCWITTVSSSSICPHRYKDRCYEEVAYTSSYSSNAENCASKGGILATIKDQETQDFLLTFLNKRSTYWIGLRVVYGIGTFADGSFLLSDSFAPWTSGFNIEKYYTETTYVYINPSTQLWYTDNYQYTSRSYICEYKEKKCSIASVDIPNGRKQWSDKDSLQPLEDLYLQCNSGYYLKGNSSITCQPNGQWSQLPQCVKGCQPPKVPDSTTLLNPQQGYEVGQTARLLCEDGFFGIGEEMKNRLDIVCNNNGSWSNIVPECHKFHDYQKISMFPKAIDVFAKKHEKVILYCTNSEFESIIWVKNGKQLMNVTYKSDVNFTDGSLTVKKLSVIDEGFYSCILKNNQHISSITYNLKMNISDKCLGDVKTSFLSVDENEDSFLQCGNVSSSEIGWYKDKQRIWGDFHQVLLPDGSLVLKKVQKSDEGEYLCSVIDQLSQCTQEFKISLFVNSLPKLQCGVTSTEFENTPWLVSLFYATDVVPFCYGTLIDDQWVLTTASCVYESHRKRFPDFYVKFTKLIGTDVGTESVGIPVSKVKIHPGYSSRFQRNDIALVQLKSAITPFLNNETKLSPLCLPEIARFFPNKIVEGFVSGLGSLNEEDIQQRRERMSIKSSKANAVLVSNTRKMFCAIATNATNDNIFAGDIGSPFEVLVEGRWIIWGIFNFADRANAAEPMSYYFLRVNYFLPWINLVRGI